MCQRFENRKKKVRNIHPISLLANGPGTRKSRFLQEIPTLLREHAENYTNDDELLDRIKYRMYAINVTFGNGTPASEEDTSIGQISVVLQILYENFISGTLGYGEFLEKCSSVKKLKIEMYSIYCSQRCYK
ncbi:hypothetical protein RhiirA1_453391 [Rhizophagus irregularis]|uniref:Uncharacterized protein n=1 Tax=Rhizophagus irregularis TaxID=588596 RepID=A0A2I1FBS4_9GLOM|nr:hypothetical protein RhiirA1_453391 [Rhizophagus irregularis]GBC12240.1 hypothetical protein GLOIN_2v1773108 [Rhizophagus irregularis DAOM 181602=DAOM 197198]PKY31852.1 hypothetical protein RhiirB3_449670 [Rhizophagus irregularis]UZO05682.1 hypothetical protein OCT59_026026 [Rhizophagus irregularis]CAB4478908.1 unnamed protein product [Rhizophagus irregularis]